MTIIDRAPCTLTLSTHGGAKIDVGFAVISSAMGGWVFRLPTEPAARTGTLYTNIAAVYLGAMHAFRERFISKEDVAFHSDQSSEIVDPWL
jgi:hypothetical protein